jgi:hypothetical protein
MGMTAIKMKRAALKRRHLRSRRTLEGTPERPRLSVYRSLKHMYAQLIDDVSGKTLMTVSTLTEGVKGDLKSTGAEGRPASGRQGEGSRHRGGLFRPRRPQVPWPGQGGGGCGAKGRLKILVSPAAAGAGPRWGARVGRKSGRRWVASGN